MYDKSCRPKMKNDKIAQWWIELSQFKCNIKYRPGKKKNSVADTFSRIAAINHPLSTLRELHKNLCHPGMTHLAHFGRTWNLPFCHEQVKVITDSCGSCQYIKPKFIKGKPGKLMQAILPFPRLSVDFKGPLPISANGNRYLLTIIDEYTWFVFACQDKLLVGIRFSSPGNEEIKVWVRLFATIVAFHLSQLLVYKKKTIPLWITGK